MRNYFKIIYRYITDSDYRFITNAYFGLYNSMPDDEYIKRRYKAIIGIEPNLENPRTFNEKMNWLKIHNRKNIYTVMVDKYMVKDYVSSLIGNEYVVPLIGVWDRFEEIDFDSLPDRFVLKTTHGCGGMYICRNKAELNISDAKKKLMRKFNQNYYFHCREWPYKNVKPRIIAEEYLQDNNSTCLNVYKVFNFNGMPRIIQVIQNDKMPDETIDYFDTDWNLLKLKQNFPNSTVHLSRPTTLKEMLYLSQKCSQNIPFLRTDWYEVNGRVYFSEFTFFSDAGFAAFEPREWDEKLGDMISLI